MKIDRTETDTGGPQRTRREEIVPVFTGSDEVEPDMMVDCSESESWEIAEGSRTSRWGVQLEAVRQFVAGAEALDSQAVAEQAGGSDEKGGIYTAFFNNQLITIGQGDDDGDLNTANFDRKVKGISPGGGTKIMPASDYLDGHYLDEFGDRPVAGRPKRARVVWTDGELRDAAQFGRRLAEDHADKWPAEHWFIAILGHGDEHDATLTQYQAIAATHPAVHVYSFQEVTNPAEIAEDVAIAVLPQTA